MLGTDKIHPAMSRRGFLTMAAAALGTAPAGGARAAGGLHVTAAAAARRLASGRSVRLRVLLPEGSGPNVLPVSEAFTAMTGIAVEHQETPVDEINLQITIDRMSNSTAYDVALPATFGLPDLAQVGAIRPLSDFARKYEPEGFRKHILYGVGDSFDDEIYGFQTDGDAYLMFYHAERLGSATEQARYEDRYGERLAVPRTWPELDRQMAFFHRPGDGMVGGLLFRTPGYVAWEWWVRLHASGAWPLTEELEPRLASEQGVLALEEMIRVSDCLAPEARSAGLFENWKRYARGDVFANIGWGGTQKYLNSDHSAMKGRMVYGPTPGGYVGDEFLLTPYFNWGWNYVVTAGTAEPEIAYLFALFASSPEMSTLSVGQVEGFFDPIRPEHYDDPQVRAAYSDAFLEVHRTSLANAIPDLYLARQSDYFLALSNWISRAVDGTAAPAEALRRVEQEWEMISYEVGREQQRRRWQALRRKYPERARALLRDL